MPRPPADEAAYFTNYGEVYGLGDSGVQFFGVDAGTLSNFGIITARLAGVKADGDNNAFMNGGTISGATGVEINGADNILTNTGLIHGLGGQASGYNLAIGIELEFNSSFATNQIINSGTVIGADFSILASGGNDLITNTGSLLGDVSLGNGSNTLRNIGDGVVAGAVTMGSGDDLLRNTGQISGDVDLNNGADIVLNLGTVIGDALLGDGADTFKGRGGVVEGTV